jgi:3-deoxy-manno-octulosonate cytidylyltransferase (CMP-KDO synthetase)
VSSETAIIVPARLGSTRLPRKLLAEVAGKPIILWTAERLRTEVPDWPLYFAVDSAELQDILAAAGFKTVMTSPDCATGTDRLAEANQKIRARRIINVQADEPLIGADHVRSLGALINEPGVEFATLACPFQSAAEMANPNMVKVVLDRAGWALYFSRAPIPWLRDAPATVSEGGAGKEGLTHPFPPLRHIGVYAYTGEFLARYAAMELTPLEQTEKLEQLRALENGHRIRVGITAQITLGIDTAEDLETFAKQRG